MKKTNKRRKKLNYDKIINRRFIVFLIVIIVLFSLLLFKVVDVIFVNGKEYKEDLTTLTHTTVSGSSSPRGRIYDRNHKLLVDNKSLKTITYQKKKGTTNLEMIDTAKKISNHIDVDFKKITDRAKREYYFAKNRSICDKLVTEKEKDKVKQRKMTQNELDELKISRIDEKELQFNDEEMNSMININKQLKEISDKVNINNNDIKNLAKENNNIYNNFIQIKDKFKLLDKNLFDINGLESNNQKNKIEIEIISEKINKLEKDLSLNKNKKEDIDDLRLDSIESLDLFNNQVNKDKESREIKYQELIKEAQNNESFIENKINELNQNQDNNMNEITNKLNEFKKQQDIINEQNTKEMDQLNKGISDQIKEFESIKRSLIDEKNNNKIMIGKRIDNLEKEIDEWLEFSKKMDKLMEQNFEENNGKLQDINNQINNLRQTFNDKLKEMKNYIDTTSELFF